jgi:hypothetical protein
MAVDGERSIHVLSPFDGLTRGGFVRSTPAVARRTPGVVLAKYEVVHDSRYIGLGARLNPLGFSSNESPRPPVTAMTHGF